MNKSRWDVQQFLFQQEKLSLQLKSIVEICKKNLQDPLHKCGKTESSQSPSMLLPLSSLYLLQVNTLQNRKSRKLHFTTISKLGRCLNILPNPWKLKKKRLINRNARKTASQLLYYFILVLFCLVFKIIQCSKMTIFLCFYLFLLLC